MKRALVLSTALWATLAAAQPSTYELSILGGGVFTDNRTNLKDHAVVAAELQYNLDCYFRPELQVLQSFKTDFTDYPGPGMVHHVSDKPSTYLTRIGLNAVHDYELESGWTPFYKLGAGYETINNNNYFDNNDGAYADAGLGVKYFFTEHFAFKAEGLYMLKLNDPHWDNNFALLGGLTFAFGGEEEPAPVEKAPEPAPVPVVVPPKVDSDHDGVYDEDDHCPDTPIDAKVDAHGCPLDSDGDGVYDDDDKCPNSVLGYAVDIDGCEVPPAINFSFKTGSAAVPEADAAQFGKYGEFVKRNDYGVKVIGHTDSVGSLKSNQKLSERRAATVAEIIKAKGVPAEHIETMGKGETEPIADNKTKEGRAKNRRVELKVVR